MALLKSLDRKLLRDLWRMRLNAISVALVLGCGLGVFVMAVGMRESLERTRQDYYLEKKMADVAVSLVRAPQRAAADISALSGVAAVETRIAGLGLLNLPGVVEPASARFVSLPRLGRPQVNDLALSRGRWPDPAKGDEAIVNQAFADALGLDVNGEIDATLYGQRQTLRIVGIANSPEFIFVAAPGELFPQPDRFGVIWMGHEALSRAFDLDGAFNEAVIRLSPHASEPRALKALDALLAPYGSVGAIGRDRMVSDRFLTEELKQLATMAAFLPTFFLLIAAFLVNIALGRVIATERGNIGLLKACGYTDMAVAWHYAKQALLLGALGAVVGSIAGDRLGRLMAGVYKEYYHFPALDFSASPGVYLAAFTAALTASGAGALYSVRRAMKLSPAEALAPPKPTSYSSVRGAVARLTEGLDAKSRIIARRILRFPRRAATTAIGIALAIALLVVSRTFPAVMDHLMTVQFNIANRQNATITFIEARNTGILHDVDRLPGVLSAEPFRVAEVTYSRSGRSVREALWGLPANGELNRIIGESGEAITPPEDGVLLARSLADRLGASPGDDVMMEQSTGRRARFSVRVAGVVQPMVGAAGYMEMSRHARAMKETDLISGANVRLDPAAYVAFNQEIKNTPGLAGVSFLTLAERSMRKSFDEGVGFMNVMYATFAAVMAGGVAFSAARITLAEQERDLATLRVLGFTRLEASYVLIGELLTLTLTAIPVGCVLGTVLARWLLSLFETDMYAFPYVYDPAGYAYAAAFTLICVLTAAFVVRRDIDRLDMVATLKARS